MKLIGQHSEGIGENQGATVSQGQAFTVKPHIHRQTFGKEDAEVVHADKGDPRKSDRSEHPEVVGLAEAFVEVSTGGDKEISGTLLGLRRGWIFSFLHLEAHHCEAEAIDEADSEKDEGEMLLRFAEDIVVKENAGDQADCAKNPVESSEQGTWNHVIDEAVEDRICHHRRQFEHAPTQANDDQGACGKARGVLAQSLMKKIAELWAEGHCDHGEDDKRNVNG